MSIKDIVKELCKNPCAELRTTPPRFEIVDAETAIGFDIERRKGWQVIGTEGIFDLPERDFVETTSRYRDGVIVQSTRLQKREYKLTIRICGCAECDLFTMQRELYDGLRCKRCANVEGDPVECIGCASMPVASGCLLRVSCCGVSLMTPVRLKSANRIKTMAQQCADYEVVLQGDDPRWFGEMRRIEIRPNEDNTFLQSCYNGIITCNPRRLRECVTIPYAGDTTGYPKIYLGGAMINPSITNTQDGASITLQRRGDYVQTACDGAVLSFWRGDQEFVTLRGDSLLQDMARDCNRLRFDGCPVELCIEADQVGDDSVIVIDWIDNYETFTPAPDATIATDANGVPC